jgi:hypothetical protein
MRIDIEVAAAMSSEDAVLIERARTALLRTERSFGREYQAVGVVWLRVNLSRPMRIDFKAVPIDGRIGQAYLGPDIPLTNDLFDGENFSANFHEKMEAAFTAFDEYLAK